MKTIRISGRHITLGLCLLIAISSSVCGGVNLKDLPEEEKALANTVDPWGVAFHDQIGAAVCAARDDEDRVEQHRQQEVRVRVRIQCKPGSLAHDAARAADRVDLVAVQLVGEQAVFPVDAKAEGSEHVTVRAGRERDALAGRVFRIEVGLKPAGRVHPVNQRDHGCLQPDLVVGDLESQARGQGVARVRW